ncbi:IS110 family transposase [Sphingobium jiangsuense]|jgi:transposase|uniref:Transposase IS116/IS110/IS902 family protein n=2 Tax=Sphingomonadaceae TaxID=41297 RepID=A0A9J9HGL3_RHIWR|nr:MULTISPECIES: IS110 family transposase [Sphingomonadaceae]ABQ71308.1 transposase IS116/IS110/IS902 family protein [Rhizorhabdus wittichii RW1]MBB3928963.1 transposase [Sphingobium jiangsuense]MBJ7499684.1 IS110 family transposase [Sphingopyxis sp.]MBP8231033.1 IS110 family transposase [Rhizorhabdus sp.]MDQ4422085.1 IS110 family transposase [Sphingobium sp. DEHP117]|tara:strand:+ start:1869 stop:3020 length:1152 start_codon:yes stop_codon:yes gene_type:complete
MENQSSDYCVQTSVIVSVELSKRTWLVASLTPGAAKISLRTIPAGDSAALLGHLRNLESKTGERIGKPAAIRLCFEIGYDGFWLARLLRANGIDTYVLDPASFLVSRRGKRVKTDRIDAEAMIGILKAYLAGDKSVCRVVDVPTPDEEDARRVMRERGDLVHERTRIISRIRGLLALQGIQSVKAISGGDWSKQLDDMRTGDGRLLPPNLRRQIERCFGRLELLNEQIKSIERDRADVVLDEASTFPCREKAIRLEQLKGIGANSAVMLVAEVFCRKFESRRHVAAFLGLAPAPYASGDVSRDQGISKAGNHGTRVLMVELAWCWLRYQPSSELAVWYRNRFKGNGGRAAKVGIVALARKLLIALWRFVETGLVPQGAELRAV